MLVLDARNVPWFPRHVSDLDVVANRILDAGTDLESDHPGFNDPVYRERRVGLAENAMNHRFGNPIPHISYSEDELATWKAVYERLETLLASHACSEYLKILPMMKQHCGYSADNIPQQADISNFLQRTTGFQLRPVAGLLSSRDFLNGLAFRTFFCTQYIRHHSMPLYTPEPGTWGASPQSPPPGPPGACRARSIQQHAHHANACARARKRSHVRAYRTPPQTSSTS